MAVARVRMPPDFYSAYTDEHVLWRRNILPDLHRQLLSYPLNRQRQPFPPVDPGVGAYLSFTPRWYATRRSQHGTMHGLGPPTKNILPVQLGPS